MSSSTKKDPPPIPACMGCKCANYAKALRTGFVDHVERRCYLASRQSTSVFPSLGSSLTNGPPIAFCPFCGAKLAQ